MLLTTETLANVTSKFQDQDVSRRAAGVYVLLCKAQKHLACCLLVFLNPESDPNLLTR